MIKEKEQLKTDNQDQSTDKIVQENVSSNENILVLPNGLTPEELGVKPVTEYIKTYKEKYYTLEWVRNSIHKKAGLSKASLFQLNFWKRFNNDKYVEETSNLIEQYAGVARENTIKKKFIEYMSKEALKVNTQVQNHEAELAKLDKKKKIAEEELQQLSVKTEAEKYNLIDTLKKQSSQVNEKLKESISSLEKNYDAEDIIQKQLEELIASSDLLVSNPNGTKTFNDNLMMQYYEDLMLNDVISGMGSYKTTESIVNTMKRELRQYKISHQDMISDPSELADVDWNQSLINAREHGRKKPMYNDLIVDKYSGRKSPTNGNIDTALVLDASGSMEDDNKWDIAKKTIFAFQSLLRKMNPDNKTYLTLFSDLLQPNITSKELMDISDKDIDGSTATADALDWMLDTLKDKELAIGYLFTDGLPNNVDKTVNAARNFRNYPNVILRIFYINSKKDFYFAESEKNIKRIGRAAGRDTKVVFVDPSKLAGNAITDISQSIKTIYEYNS